VLRICDRFGVLPSAVLAEDSDMLRMLMVESLGSDRGEGGEEVPE
jgi:hypothetical protein